MLGTLALAVILLGATGSYNQSRLERYIQPPQYWYMKSDSVLVTPRDQRKAERVSRRIARQAEKRTKKLE